MDPRLRGIAPPPEVTRAWGVGVVELLPGGQGSAYADDRLMLKPVFDVEESTWLATVLSDLPEPSTFRLIRPVPARDGEWIVSGWSAWARLDGVVQAGAWREALAVSALLHAHTAHVDSAPPPDRSHPWAVGDRWAWGEQELTVAAPFTELAARLVDRRAAVTASAQFIHGDLINNILSGPGRLPAVIDVSPYWRPARYADAIIAVDAVGWNGADAAEVEALFTDPEGQQLLLRAVLFRLGSAITMLGENSERLRSELSTYERLECELLSR